jgi:hypothetical protein
MLPLGHIGIRSVDGGGSDRYTRFTQAEQRTMMTLWSLFQSPLFFGGELTDNDEWTLDLLRNEGLRDMHANGLNPTQLSRKDDIVIWKTVTNTHEWVAVFNLNDETAEIELDLNQYCDKKTDTCTELFSGENFTGTTTRIEAHDVKVFKL